MKVGQALSSPRSPVGSGLRPQRAPCPRAPACSQWLDGPSDRRAPSPLSLLGTCAARAELLGAQEGTWPTHTSASSDQLRLHIGVGRIFERDWCRSQAASRRCPRASGALLWSTGRPLWVHRARCCGPGAGAALPAGTRTQTSGGPVLRTERRHRSTRMVTASCFHAVCVSAHSTVSAEALWALSV